MEKREKGSNYIRCGVVKISHEAHTYFPHLYAPSIVNLYINIYIGNGEKNREI